MCTKPTSLAITFVQSPYGSTQACDANQYGVQRTFNVNIRPEPVLVGHAW